MQQQAAQCTNTSDSNKELLHGPSTYCNYSEDSGHSGEHKETLETEIVTMEDYFSTK